MLLHTEGAPPLGPSPHNKWRHIPEMANDIEQINREPRYLGHGQKEVADVLGIHPKYLQRILQQLRIQTASP